MTAPRQARVWLGSFSKHSTEIEFSTFAELRYGLDTFCTYRNIQGSTAVFRGTQKMLLPNTLPPNTDPVDIYIDTTPLDAVELKALFGPLPDFDFDSSSQSGRDRDLDRGTYPMHLKTWLDFPTAVKAGLAQHLPDIDAKTYAAMVLVLDAHVLGEDSAVATFICTAGARVNHILNQNGHGDIKWTIHPSRRRTDQQQAEPPALDALDALDEAAQLKEGQLTDVPDAKLLTMKRGACLCTAEAKSTTRLKGLEATKIEEIVKWATSDLPEGERTLPPALNTWAIHNSIHAIGQLVGYMSRRGHLMGVLTTHKHTWILQHVGDGAFEMSPAISSKARSTDSTVSTTEALLYASVSSIKHHRDTLRSVIPTATTLCGQTRSQADVDELPSWTRSGRVRGENSSQQQQPGSVGSHQRPQNEAAFFPIEEPLNIANLHLERMLKRRTYLGSYDGHPVAVRIASLPAHHAAAQQEVAAYCRMPSLQGLHIPQLKAHGYTLGGRVYFVATEFVQGQSWDWGSPAHLRLGPQLLEVLGRIHDHGIYHGDLHPGNLLVTPENVVFVLDFAGCDLSADEHALYQEQRFIADIFPDNSAGVAAPPTEERPRTVRVKS